jgi:hypothetical protein
MAVREHLRRNGIARSFHGVTSMLASRVYLGELNFGKLTNPESHTAIVDADTWSTVQRIRSPRGPRAKSERLLARLGILRCGTCGARMVVGSTRQQGKSYAFYRCIPTSDCAQRVTISAEIAEQTVTQAVQDLLADVEGSASIVSGVADAERDLASAERELDAAVEAFTGLEDVTAARTRLLELREARDSARERLADVEAAAGPSVTVTAADWDALTTDERRALIRATIAEATVAPGRGADRITVTAHGSVTS